MSFRIYKYDDKGNLVETDRAWLLANFGDVPVIQASQEETAFRLVAVREKIGPATVIVRVVDGNGNRMTGVPVIRWWSTAPKLPVWTGLPEHWVDRGVIGQTNAEGEVGFGMGTGDYYWPDRGEVGASGVFIGKPGMGSDFWGGLGMVAGTEHRHIDLEVQMVTGSPAPDERAWGVDLSEHNEIVDFDELKAAGTSFVWLRASYAASDGKNHLDPMFEWNRDEAERVGLLWGAYHYFKQEVWEQAKFFAAAVGDPPPPLGYALDCEEDTLTKSKVLTGLRATDDHVGQAVKVYSNLKTLNRIGWDVLDGRDLWIAQYQVEEPTITAAWEFWQARGAAAPGTVPGVDTSVGIDYYNGTVAELKAKYGYGSDIEAAIMLLNEAEMLIVEAKAILEGIT